MTVSVQVLIIAITTITRITCNTQPCGIGCTVCAANNNCNKCQNGYFLFYTYTNTNYQFRCNECPSKCKTCKSLTFQPENVQCETCSVCKNEECDNNGCLNGCKTGYYLKNNLCEECSFRCTECTSRHICSSCKPGWFGDGCRFSCIPCSQCDYERCRKDCREYQDDRCVNANSECLDKGSINFSGALRDDIVPSTIQTSTTSTTQRLTTRSTPSTTTRSTISTTTRSTLSTTTRSNTPLTTRSTSTATRRRTQLTSKPPKPRPSTSVSSKTDGPDTPTLYILIAVIGVLFLVVSIVVVIVIKKRKQTSRSDHGSVSQDTKVKNKRRNS